MTDREYPHPRALLEELDADELRDLADEIALQLASLEIALEKRMTTRIFGSKMPTNPRNRAAEIILGSTKRRRDH